MDRAEYVKKLEELATSERETLQTNAIAHVVYLAEGKFEEAAWALKEATLAHWRINLVKMEQASGRMWDRSYDDLFEDAQSGRGFDSHFELVKKLWAQRAFREFQAAWRMFAEEGVRLGPHLMEKLYALDPTEREKKVRGFSPTDLDIKDVISPCEHDLAPVICEELTYGRVVPVKVICTECCQRFEAIGGPTAALVRRPEVNQPAFNPEALSMGRSVRILQISRPYVQS